MSRQPSALLVKTVTQHRRLAIPNKYKITGVLFIMKLSFGMVNNLDGPVLVDFEYIFKVSMDWLALFYVFAGIGYLIGSLSGFLYTLFNRQLTLAISQLVSSVAVGFYPLAPSLGIFLGQSLIQGIGSGAFDLIQSVWLIELWQDRCQPVLHLSEMINGVGSVLAPLIERPFLTGIPRNKTFDHRNMALVTVANLTSEVQFVTPEQRRANLTIPFAVFGGSMLIGGFLMLLLFIWKKYEPPPVEELMLNGDQSPKIFEDNHRWRVSMIILMSLTLAFFEVVQDSFHSFGPTFSQLIPLQITAQEAAYIQSGQAAAFTLGRGINFFVSMKIKPESMLAFHYTIIILSLLALELFASESLLLLWSANIAIGYGFSSVWPSLFAHSEQYLVITDKVASVILSVTCLFWTVVPYLVGRLIEDNPKSLIHYSMFFISISLTLFIATRVGVYFKKAQDQESMKKFRDDKSNDLESSSLTSGKKSDD